MISIDSTIGKKLIDQLVEELSTPRKDIDNSGRTKVESKKDLAKRKVESPNVADSFIIANSGRMMRRRSVNEWL
jgi:phage terminase large subunit